MQYSYQRLLAVEVLPLKSIIVTLQCHVAGVIIYLHAVLYAQGLRFFLSREVPKHWMEFMIISCGGKVGWEGSGSPYTINDATVTHHVVDRPPTTTQQGTSFY
jgi:hypothetical protein